LLWTPSRISSSSSPTNLGNADLGYRGSDIKTPNIDKLANEGVKLESFYGMPVCTPSRAELMTGRYAMRYGLETLVIFPSHTYGLATDERTLAEALKDAGYDTAMVGKWHLGHADKKYWPQNRGFDHFYGNLVGEVDYFTKERGGIIDWQRNGEFLKEEGYFTTLIGNEAVDTIEQQDTSRPLFLYVASLAPHAPYQAPDEAIKTYKDLSGDGHRKAYAAMIRARYAGWSHRRCAQAERHARQHTHHFLERQWWRYQRIVCHRRTLARRARRERRGRA
jgi:arylsulfatase A-like enzyme